MAKAYAEMNLRKTPSQTDHLKDGRETPADKLEGLINRDPSEATQGRTRRRQTYARQSGTFLGRRWQAG